MHQAWKWYATLLPTSTVQNPVTHTHLTAKESGKCLALGPRVKGGGHSELLTSLCQSYLVGSVPCHILRPSPNSSGSQISKGEEFTPIRKLKWERNLVFPLRWELQGWSSDPSAARTTRGAAAGENKNVLGNTVSHCWPCFPNVWP